MIGYGDEFEAETRPGYKLLRESDRQIFYSQDVWFDKKKPMSSLPELKGDLIIDLGLPIQYRAISTFGCGE